MAATLEARRLTEAHRKAQAQLGAETVRLVLAAWNLLDLEDLDRTFENWLQVLVPIIRSQRRTSATLAANYLQTFRTLELGLAAGRLAPVIADDVPLTQLATSLLVTGPVSIRSNLARKVPVHRALDKAKTASAGAAMRHALNGGRQTIVQSLDGDDKALGWARTTSGSPCSFCAMLVGRGPVYRGERSANFEAHDNCSCSAEPVYRDDAAWTPGARRYADLWEKSTAGLGGDEARNAFRLALKAQAD